MNLEKDLADKFASSRPSVAARVLEALPEHDVLDLLARSDFRAAAAIVAALTPLEASRCLSLVSGARAAEIISELPLDRAADLLRRLEVGEREDMLSHLSQQQRRPLERLLGFPAHTAGAMMEPRVESFPETMTVDETLGKVRRPGCQLRYYLYIVDDDLVLTGVASLRDLISGSPNKTLRSIMRRPVQTLSARAGTSATLEHPAWRRYPVLPVIDDAGRLVGVFRYETYRRLQDLPESEEASALTVALALGELFWLGASGMLRRLEQPSSARQEEET